MSKDEGPDRAKIDANVQRVTGRGDDERENREHIEQTGEPDRDEFGNADGAS